MDNYTAIAYATLALTELKKEHREVDEVSLKGKMLYLMDMYSEKEILEKVKA